MSETVSEWRLRKLAQGIAAMIRYPGVSFEYWQDYETKFVLLRAAGADPRYLVIGQLERIRDRSFEGQLRIDMSDAVIDEWARS